MTCIFLRAALCRCYVYVMFSFFVFSDFFWSGVCSITFSRLGAHVTPCDGSACFFIRAVLFCFLCVRVVCVCVCVCVNLIAQVIQHHNGQAFALRRFDTARTTAKIVAMGTEIWLSMPEHPAITRPREVS